MEVVKWRLPLMLKWRAIRHIRRGLADPPAGAGSRAGKLARIRAARKLSPPPWILPPVLTAGICHCQTCIPRHVFPSENGLRCGTRELNYGPHQWRGDFQFNISRYSQQQLMGNQPSPSAARGRRHMANIDGFHMALVATTPGARQCRRNSTLAPVATITSCSGVKNNNNRAGHVCRIA
ncbi:beta-galactosidase small subunit-related protein [Enterobacter hormaechei]